MEFEDLNEIYSIKKKVLEDVDPSKKIALRKKVRKQILISLLELVIFVAAVFFILYICFGVSTVSGNSMYPTLHDGDIVVYLQNVSSYKQGDIVVVKRPRGKEYVKRVVALPGDTVNIQNGKIYVNGKEYKTDKSIGKTYRVDENIENPYLVGEQEVFVLGDNREDSEDSRSFGSVSFHSLKGKLLLYQGFLDKQ